jgi:hypothetical protein
MLAHLCHTQKPELNIIWARSNELRRIKEFLDSLPKGKPHLVIFDDVSNALDQLKGPEASEAFEILTQGRHITRAQLAIITIYHYTFSHKKNFRSMGSFSIYTSATPTERGNISHMLKDSFAAKQKFKAFQRIYQCSNDNGFFMLDIGTNEPKRFVNSDPFRCTFVINLSNVNLMLVKKMSCNLCSTKQREERIQSGVLIEKMKGVYDKYGLLALSLLAYNKGYKYALTNHLRNALDFGADLLAEYSVDYADLTEKVRLERKINNKRVYRKRKDELKLKDVIITESHFVEQQEKEKLNQRIETGFNQLFI